MGRESLLGAFEEQVLLAVAHLGAGAYGMTVRRAIVDRTGREVAIGAVYATLDRLEGKGLVVSRLGDGDAERRGRARRYFALRPEGADALRRARELHARMWEGLDAAALGAEERG